MRWLAYNHCKHIHTPAEHRIDFRLKKVFCPKPKRDDLVDADRKVSRLEKNRKSEREREQKLESATYSKRKHCVSKFVTAALPLPDGIVYVCLCEQSRDMHYKLQGLCDLLCESKPIPRICLSPRDLSAATKFVYEKQILNVYGTYKSTCLRIGFYTPKAQGHPLSPSRLRQRYTKQERLTIYIFWPKLLYRHCVLTHKHTHTHTNKHTTFTNTQGGGRCQGACKSGWGQAMDYWHSHTIRLLLHTHTHTHNGRTGGGSGDWSICSWICCTKTFAKA